MNNKKSYKLEALRAAFPHTIPVMAGYIFLGLTYGILMTTSGFSIAYPIFSSAIIYTGAVEFLLVSILKSAFNPLSAFLTAFIVGARHLFYGISMLDKYKGSGLKKFYLIYTTSDETFAVNYSAEIPVGIRKDWFYFWVSILDQLYWVSGSTLGALFGSMLNIELIGLDFVMTTMFITIFLDQWLKDSKRTTSFMKKHLSSIIGVIGSLVALLIFGADHFIIPAMIIIFVSLLVLRPYLDTEDDENTEKNIDNK